MGILVIAVKYKDNPIDKWLKKKGWFLYDHQVEAFNLIRQGYDVILHAPTGGGKTIGGFMPSINDFINNKWYTLDRADFQKKMGLKLTPYIIYQQNISADNNRIAVKPNLISKINHLNYALTWFFLSLTLCVIFSIYYNRNY